MKVVYSKVYYPDLQLNLTDGYKVQRIFSADHDTFIAVLDKPGFPQRYSVFFTEVKGENLTTKYSVQTSLSSDFQTVFKVFKLGDGIFCIVLKANGGNSAKLTITCAEDKLDGQTKLSMTTITNQYEVSDIQFLEATFRVDFLMIGITEQAGRNV